MEESEKHNPTKTRTVPTNENMVKGSPSIRTLKRAVMEGTK
jgi:hypothetical protein